MRPSRKRLNRKSGKNRAANRPTNSLPYQQLEAKELLAGVGWDGPGQGSAELTYYVGKAPQGITQAQFQTTIDQALKVWADSINVKFTQTQQTGLANSLDFTSRPIDGTGGVLARAYFPKDVIEAVLLVTFSSIRPTTGKSETQKGIRHSICCTSQSTRSVMRSVLITSKGVLQFFRQRSMEIKHFRVYQPPISMRRWNFTHLQKTRPIPLRPMKNPTTQIRKIPTTKHQTRVPKIRQHPRSAQLQKNLEMGNLIPKHLIPILAMKSPTFHPTANLTAGLPKTNSIRSHLMTMIQQVPTMDRLTIRSWTRNINVSSDS